MLDDLSVCAHFVVADHFLLVSQCIERALLLRSLSVAASPSHDIPRWYFPCLNHAYVVVSVCCSNLTGTVTSILSEVQFILADGDKSIMMIFFVFGFKGSFQSIIGKSGFLVGDGLNFVKY